MSWIQNFFQKFKKDEEEELNEFVIHNTRNDELPHQNQYESLKDLDTRISYQYPKGGLRSSTTPLHEVKPKAKEVVRQQRILEKQPEKRRRREQKESQPVKTEVPKPIKEPKQQPRMRGPFHPTEIPSPIFGFNRPKKTELIVEHELSQFLNEEDKDQLNHSAVFEELIAEASVNTAEEYSIESLPENVIETIEYESEPLEVEPHLPVETSVELQPEPEDVIETQPEQPETKRSRLPFNVMMLKQDRVKWEERQQRQQRRECEQPIQARENILVEKTVDTSLERLLDRALVEPKDSTIEQPVDKPKEKPTEKPIIQAVVSSPTVVGKVEQRTSNGTYMLPPSSLLHPPVKEDRDIGWLLEQEELLNITLKNFNVGASVVNVTQGPSVTRFEVQPEPGVKVNKITNLSDDIKLSLAARDIRIEAPIPGKHTIGIEVPNQKSRPVFINEIIQSNVFQESTSPLTAVMGLDIAGKPIVTDLNKMPHGLIAGATGSGKSVCINTILVSLLCKASPEDLKLLLIDPKVVELAPYNRIPHLVSPVITDVKAATAALKWAVDEMERRYELFAHAGVRDINRFNEVAIKHKRYSDKLPFIVIIIDELADLMMMSPADVEEAICRIAQKARACGIHLIVATQRPSVDVITGLIKANIPTRIAFSVSSQVDSRTIIDISGAEKLLGRGDMLFLENGSSKPVRLQGTFVSDEEIDRVVAHARDQREPEYLFEQEELLKKAQIIEEEDELFYEACEFIIEQGGASTSSLQRRFKIGYNRAARLMDILEQNGYITSANGSKPRDVLITEADLEAIHE
ncbi:DNA translocase FtsK [Neobacillus rhizosphaerae]|uniref:DNA translocase FtsK n=1 Tax=Neobacillus rhizosphaerae TaxID=2880965 RepID=UPI003D2C1A96